MYMIHNGQELISIAGEGLLLGVAISKFYVQNPHVLNDQELAYIVKFYSSDFQILINGKMQNVDPDAEYFCFAKRNEGFQLLDDVLLTPNDGDEE